MPKYCVILKKVSKEERQVEADSHEDAEAKVVEQGLGEVTNLYGEEVEVWDVEELE